MRERRVGLTLATRRVVASIVAIAFSNVGIVGGANASRRTNHAFDDSVHAIRLPTVAIRHPNERITRRRHGIGSHGAALGSPSNWIVARGHARPQGRDAILSAREPIRHASVGIAARKRAMNR